ncbi:MAG: hypothetical protein ACUVWR_10845 [Anaerolineae bacterium]
MRRVGILAIVVFVLAIVAVVVLTRPKSRPTPTVASSPMVTATSESAAAPTGAVTAEMAATAPTEASPATATPAFVSPISPLPYTRRGLPLSSGRSATALSSYSLAEATAKQWSSDAYFLGIMPSWIMERNLPMLPAKAGWFYRFGHPADTLELYVQVADGAVTGSTEAQAIRFDDFKPTPLDRATVKLDSSDVRQIYLDSLNGGQASDDNLDYALQFDANLNKPVWFIYDLARGEEAVMAVDAATGETIQIEQS